MPNTNTWSAPTKTTTVSAQHVQYLFIWKRSCCMKLNGDFSLIRTYKPCFKDTDIDVELPFTLPPHQTDFITPCLCFYTHELSIGLHLLGILEVQSCQNNLLEQKKMFPLKQKCKHWNDQTGTGPLYLIPLTPQSPLLNMFILYLFIFIYCEVTMDRSSVNVAKGKARYIGASKLLCNNKK